MFVFKIVFLFSLPLFTLSVLSLSLPLSSFTRPTLSRKVPPYKPGSAQGFFLLKGSSFLATVLTWGFWLWVSASVKCLEGIYIKRCYTNELN